MNDRPEQTEYEKMRETAADAVGALANLLASIPERPEYGAVTAFVRRAQDFLGLTEPEERDVERAPLPEWYQLSPRSRDVPPDLLGLMHEAMALGDRDDVAANDAMRASLAAMHYYEGPPPQPSMFAGNDFDLWRHVTAPHRGKRGVIGMLARHLDDAATAVHDLRLELARLRAERMVVEAERPDVNVRLLFNAQTTSLTIDNMLMADVGHLIELLREAGWPVEINLGRRG